MKHGRTSYILQDVRAALQAARLLVRQTHLRADRTNSSAVAAEMSPVHLLWPDRQQNPDLTRPDQLTWTRKGEFVLKYGINKLPVVKFIFN